MLTGRMKLRIYPLAEGYPITPDGKPLYSYGSEVYYAPAHEDRPFYVTSGGSKYGNGAFLNAAELLRPEWQSDLRIAEAEWLISVLERIAQGEDLTLSDILEAYRQVHGTTPTAEERTFY